MFNEKTLQQIDNYEVELPANDWEILSQKINQKKRKAFPMWWYAAAAGVALLVGFGFVFFDFGTHNSPQIAQINTDNLIIDSTENRTQIAQEAHLKSRKEINTNNYTINKQKKSTLAKRNEIIKQISDEVAEKENILQEKNILIENNNLSNEEKKSNFSQQISIEEAEKLMHASATFSDRSSTTLTDRTAPERSQRHNQYYASLSASSSPTAFGHTETTPRRMFIPSIKGDNAILRNIGTETKYDLPLTFAFTFGIPLVNRLHLNTGLQYTYIHSKTEKFENDTRKPINRDDQELHYLGIPLMLSYRIVDKNIFKLYVSGGGVAEKGLLETHNVRNFDDTNIENVTLPTDKKNRKIEGFQFSLNANLGASVTLVKGLALYAEPGLAWYIPATKYRQPDSRRTKNPFFVSITAGLRFNFEK